MGMNNCTCKNCGGENENGDVFCRYCGSLLPGKNDIQVKRKRQKKELIIPLIFVAIACALIVLFVINNCKKNEYLEMESSLLNDNSYEIYSLGDIKFRIPDTYTEVNVDKVDDDTLAFTDKGGSNIFIVTMMVNSNKKLVDEFIDETYEDAKYNPKTKFYTFNEADEGDIYGYLSEGENFYIFAITGDEALSILDTVEQK